MFTVTWAYCTPYDRGWLAFCSKFVRWICYLWKGLILRMFVTSLTIPFWKQTVPLSLTYVILYGPSYSSSCFECFRALISILSLREYWGTHRDLFSHLLFSLIQVCFCCLICSQWTSKVRMMFPIVWWTSSIIAFACGFRVVIAFIFRPYSRLWLFWRILPWILYLGLLG